VWRGGLSERNKKLCHLIQLNYESPFDLPRSLDYLRDAEDSLIKASIASEELRFLLQPGPEASLIVLTKRSAVCSMAGPSSCSRCGWFTLSELRVEQHRV
jgi:hypothetical protein